jgi:two-component system chemotaxis sensor kinase CheA
MTNDGSKPFSDLLDEMALKILMIEPGDLSVVGELLDLVEKFIEESGKYSSRVFQVMGTSFKSALEKIIMGELPESAENYDHLGRCITEMQETLRKEGQADENILKAYCENLNAVGYAITPEVFNESSEEGGGETAGEEPAAREPALPEPVGKEAAAEESPMAEKPKPAGVKEVVAVPDFLQDKDLLAGFIEEAFEHLEAIEVNVLDLEQSPDDLEIINNIFRPFHTIKGVSGFLNLKTINKLAHATENLLDDVRNGKRAMDSEVIDLVLKVGDVLKSMVQNIKNVLQSGPEKFEETDIGEYLLEIARIQDGAGGAPAAPPPKKEKPVKKAAVKPPEPEAIPSIPMELLEDLVEEPEEADRVESAAVLPSSPSPQEGSGAAPQQAQAETAQKKRLGSSIKVDVDKLDALVNAVGELVIMQSLVRQNPLVLRITDPKLSKDFSQLSRITSELQRTAMSMRMVPIKQTFDKMIRLVRDLSKKSGKKVDLVMEGAETEIDRNMVDSIYDPLVHMMRNSVDHGVRPPAEREQVGKPGAGTVFLRAYQKGGNMVIEIQDDGDGLNTTKIRQKAIERGLIEEGDTLTDYELNNLIFVPGFSTADKITDVSGRGVGMDVVKKGVERLRGKVEVHSQPGKGTQFVIRLPLTLAIIDGIIVRVGIERYIIPTIAIQESMHPERKNYNTVHGKGETLLVRGNLLPIIRLYELFQVKPSYTDPCEAIVVVVENEGRRRALMVDELLGKEEVVIKNLGGLQDIPGVAGGTILGDGCVGLILDLAGIIGTAVVAAD